MTTIEFTQDLVKRTLFKNTEQNAEEIFAMVYQNNIPEALKNIAINDYIHNELTPKEKEIVKVLLKTIREEGVIKEIYELEIKPAVCENCVFLTPLDICMNKQAMYDTNMSQEKEYWYCAEIRIQGKERKRK